MNAFTFTRPFPLRLGRRRGTAIVGGNNRQATSPMSKLKQALQHHGVDAGNLVALFGDGRELVHGLVTDGASAVDIWRRLRLAAGEIGYWPLILGREHDLDRHRDWFAEVSDKPASRPVPDLIAAGLKVNVVEWLTQRAAAEQPILDEGEWPQGNSAIHQFRLPMEADGKTPLSRVVVGLVPTVIGWQVPAFLRFGGWKSCPAPEHHVAMLKYWRHLYGVEIVGLGSQMLEVAVSRPPMDRPSALRLAREQHVYCRRTIGAGGPSLKSRAAMLLGATAWSFGWE